MARIGKLAKIEEAVRAKEDGQDKEGMGCFSGNVDGFTDKNLTVDKQYSH